MVGRRKRVLFLSYWVPPRNSIGTIRASHLIQHLPKFGWDVDVVTAHLNGESANGAAASRQTGYYDVKRAIKRVSGIGDRSTSAALNLRDDRYGGKPGIAARAVRFAAELVTYPDEYVGWLPFATRTVRKCLRAGSYDALLTSAPPATTNVIAALSCGDVPWIADLRDLWAEDDSRERSLMQKLFDDKLERTTLSHAAALISSSKLSAKRFQNRYPSKSCYAISTGYDPEEWNGVEFGTEVPCTLLYAGSFYRGKRDPGLLFTALREILDEGLAAPREIRVDCYSVCEAWLAEVVAQAGLQDVVRVCGSIDRSAVLSAQRRADRLLIFSWDGPTAEGVVPGKLFEYFGARRPVLAIGGTPASSVQELLEETGAGVRCLSVDEVKAEVLAALREHRQAQRTISDDAVSAYTSERCASRFAQVLDSVVP